MQSNEDCRAKKSLLEYAYDIRSVGYKRELLEAVLLAGATGNEIEAVFDIPEPVVDIYRFWFFDIDVFSDRLDRLDYAYTYEASKFGAECKKYAVDFGKESLFARYSGGEYQISADVVRNSVRATAYNMAILAKTNPADSSVANAALRWSKIALDSSPEDSDASRDELLDNLSISLKTEEAVTNEDESGIDPDEIIH